MTFGSMMRGAGAGALMLAMLTGAAGPAFAFGALAIDGNHGGKFGWAKGYGSQDDADDEALQECGAHCSVVLQFWNGCGAYAADQAYGSTAYGWGTGSSQGDAESIALGECEGHGGTSCIVRVWACE